MVCLVVTFFRFALWTYLTWWYCILFSPSEHDRGVHELTKKLEEVEAKITQAEADKPAYNEKECRNSLEHSKKELDKQKVERKK